LVFVNSFNEGERSYHSDYCGRKKEARFEKRRDARDEIQEEILDVNFPHDSLLSGEFLIEKIGGYSLTSPENLLNT
jgi:hypothetical protein